ncbi:MAG: alpha/beta hydrolase [Asticcacaulis sp.]
MSNRRDFMSLGAAMAVICASGGGSVNAQTPKTKDRAGFFQDIWPGNPPGGGKVTAAEEVILRNPKGGNPDDTAFLHVRKPWLVVRKPAKPNGAAMLIMPGGGYVRVAVSKAGGDIDAWLASEGITTFTMDYRLPADGWAAGPDVALQDAQRAIRIIRARSAELGIDPERIGVIGFSAGGHVAGLLATRWAEKSYAPIDAIDQQSARPAVVAMMYPVVTMMAPYAHGGSLKELLGSAPSDAARQASSVERHVTADTPPTFVGGTTDDPVVPMQNAILMFEALKAAKIPSELHLYEGATHGFPLHNSKGDLMPWAAPTLSFLRRHGLDAAKS